MKKLLVILVISAGINISAFADGSAEYKNSTGTTLNILNSKMEQTTWGTLSNSWWEVDHGHCNNNICDYYFQAPNGEYIHIYNDNSTGNNNGFWSDSTNGTHSNFSKGTTACFEIKSTNIDYPSPSAAPAAGSYWVDIYNC